MTRGAEACIGIFGCCHFIYDMYMCTVHAVRPCAARVLRAFECVGFRRVCISLGWSCGVFLMRVSEVKPVLGNTFRPFACFC